MLKCQRKRAQISIDVIPDFFFFSLTNKREIIGRLYMHIFPAEQPDKDKNRSLYVYPYFE